MVSVTRRTRDVKQPRGGFIRPRDFTVTELNDGLNLYEKENIHSVLIGMAVDYLTRVQIGTPVEEAFKISLQGARNVNESTLANQLLDTVNELDDRSIESACKLVGFDVAFRNSIAAYKPVQAIQPDAATISNVRAMVKRSKDFVSEYGPIIQDGFTFQGAYTNKITTGDGDFLTKDTLWDFKVSKNPPTSKHTLQLFVYYLMGTCSVHKFFDSIKRLGMFNPRLNKVYLLNINEITDEVVAQVSSEVIGYED